MAKGWPRRKRMEACRCVGTLPIARHESRSNGQGSLLTAKHRKFFHLAMRRGRKIAKVAMARKLAVHLYWMWRQGCDYGQTQKLGFARGKARKSRWWAVQRRCNDWASRSQQVREFSKANLDRSAGSKRWLGRTEFLTRMIPSEPRLERRKPTERAKWRSSMSAYTSVAQKRPSHRRHC